ncbi:hypothetical protein HPP92_019084 [Vanilla planifolia]|uniref:CCT domain-containing protein n=1 Tax=Vanilla planifolia TaxID=51239 RepID=A0A835QDA9_VANPL|nr:hypothetical protein HPP92_019084 [Vanilla planifolia]
MFHTSSSSSSLRNPASAPYEGEHHHPPSLLSSSFPTSSYFLQRSSRSQTLPLASGVSDQRSFSEFDQEPVRRVLSTGDLQCTNGGSFALSDAVASARVGRYSAEERRERIERYRSKRNQRNFHKKITYACRKTLADSRPRVRGRFARNGEIEHETETETDTSARGFDNWNSWHVAGDVGDGGAEEWWKQMQAALLTADEEDSGYDEELWANLDSVFAMDLGGSFS